jgi:hypothetical protein
MTFQLSKFPPYAAAITASIEGDLATARSEYAKCLLAAREAGGPPMISGLLNRLGNVEARDGNRARAIELYEEALLADPGSPLALISYAESLVDALADPVAAAAKLQSAEDLLASGQWHETGGDLSLASYEHLIAQVRSKISRLSSAA